MASGHSYYVVGVIKTKNRNLQNWRWVLDLIPKNQVVLFKLSITYPSFSRTAQTDLDHFGTRLFMFMIRDICVMVFRVRYPTNDKKIIGKNTIIMMAMFGHFMVKLYLNNIFNILIDFFCFRMV